MPWKQLPDLPRLRLRILKEGLVDHLDPYLIWADATDFTSFCRPVSGADNDPLEIENDTAIPFMVDLSFERRQAGAMHAAAVERIPIPGLNLLEQIIPIAFLPLLRTFRGRWFFTTNIPLIAYPSAHSTPRQFRLTLGMPRIVPPAFKITECNLNQPPIPDDEKLDGPILGIIDDGCAFAHTAFRARNGTSTRVRYLWDQGPQTPDPADAHWRPPPDFGYGRELTGAKADSLLAKHGCGTSAGDAACYEAIRYNAVARRFAHGTHVLDLAAGHPNPWNPSAPREANEQKEPRVVFVQLPRNTVRDTSGGSLGMHILDGLRYISNRAKPGSDVVVNISFGALAGPHDGSGLIEQAIDALIVEQQSFSGLRNFSVVLPAGNGYATKTHARLKVPAGSSRAMYWSIAPDNQTTSFMELWVPSSATVKVRLVPPDTDHCAAPWVGLHEARLLDHGDHVLAGAIFPAEAPNGQRDELALLAVGPTRWRRHDYPAAPHGIWTVLVSNESDEHPVTIEAWIERDDRGADPDGPGAQSEFHDPAAEYIVPDGSMSGVAHGVHTIVVGGFDLSRQSTAEYSGSGPGRIPSVRSGPDVQVPSEDASTKGGILAAGTASGDTVRMNGTSVAAPVAARRILALMTRLNRSLSSEEIRSFAFDDAVLGDESPLRAGRGRIVPP